MTAEAVRPARQAAGAAATVAVRLPPAALWLAAAVVSGFTLRRNLEPFDEGVLLQAAARMAAGQWPWRDFGWAYGPGQPLVIAAAFKALGASVLWWRLLRVAVDASTALLVWALVRERAGARWALAAWAAAAVTAAQPVSANPTSAALAFSLAAVLLATHGRPGWAGAAGAAAAFWRPDLGVCAALAAAVSAPRGGRLRCVGAAVGAAALLYAPFVAAAGIGRTWRALVVQARHDGAWWRLPFPDGYHGAVSARPEDLKDVITWTLPYLGLAALAVAVGVIAVRGSGRPPATGLAVLALGALAYLLSRADEFHTQPLILVACALVPLAAARAPRPAAALLGAAPRPAAALLGAALALLLAGGAANRLSALLHPPDLVALHLPGVPDIGVPPGEARALPPLVGLVQRLDPPGAPIYVAPRRSDLVTSADPLLHFLTRRPNVLHRDALLQAKPDEQARIAAALRAARPRVVIRWTDPASSHPEPNLRGRPSGSRALDAYLAAAYRERARFGPYVVLVPRP